MSTPPRPPQAAARVAGWLRQYFVVAGQAIELRVIHKDGSITAGFFDHDHLDLMADHGLRLSQSAGVKGAYFTLNPLRPEVLGRAGLANQLRKARKGEIASAADVAARRWLFVDVDPVRPGNCSATDAEKAAALATALRARDFLAGQGWPAPLLADSGNGYHLLYRVDLPADDGGLVRRVLQALATRFDDAATEIDTKVHDAPRITKLYGGRACKGEPTDERPHRWTGIVDAPAEPLEVVPRRLLEELAGGLPVEVRPAPQGGGGSGGSPSVATPGLSTDRRLALARAYLAKLPAAVEGQGGDKQTFAAACTLVIDFALGPAEALPVLLEFNKRAVPPWSEEQLAYKLQKALEKADERPEERGRLLRAAGEGPGRPGPCGGPATPAECPADAGPFLGTVPDFVLADWEQARPWLRGPDERGRRRRGRRGIYIGLWWLLHREVIRVKREAVCLADVTLGQVVWGYRRDWPANWRQRLRRWMLTILRVIRRDPKVGPDELTPSPDCGPDCPLHGRGEVRHTHFRLTVAPVLKGPNAYGWALDLDRSFLGVLELCRIWEDGGRTFDFTLPRSDRPKEDGEGQEEEALQTQEKIDHHRKSGRLCAVYLPALIFGASPRAGLTPVQRNLLIALPRELTRSKRSGREDKAAVVVGGQPAARGGAPRRSACPFLAPGQRYVAFGGNGGYKRRHLRGRGYALLGRTGGGWLHRAGFITPADEKGRWAAVRRFLLALQGLAGPFGLVVAAWHPGKKEWRPLEDLLVMARGRAGRAWLGRCLLRVFAPEDYLARWRSCFAARLGLSCIPGDGDEGGPRPAAGSGGPAVESAADLDLWMRRAGVTDRQLAARLGRSRSLVSAYRSGRRPWSAAFQDRVAAVVAAWGGGQAPEAPPRVPELTLHPVEGTQNSR
jgi:hypothetical protein